MIYHKVAMIIAKLKSIDIQNGYILGISFLCFFDEYLSSEPKSQVLDTTKIKTVLLDQFSSKSCVCECSQKV